MTVEDYITIHLTISSLPFQHVVLSFIQYEYNFYPPNGGPQYVMGNQNGPQPQGPPMQPPGSPPRPPCYNQQMPYSTDPMYYNISMYGPVEGTALYTESMDIPNNNPYIEVMHV